MKEDASLGQTDAMALEAAQFGFSFYGGVGLRSYLRFLLCGERNSRLRACLSLLHGARQLTQQAVRVQD